MYKHILIATDGSDLAGKAVTTGLSLAKALNAKVTAITATEPWTTMVAGDMPTFTFPIEDYDKAAAENAERILAKVREDAAKLGVTCETTHVLEYPADAIIATAKSKGCDLIVMSSHGRRGLARVLLGSQAIEVLTHSPLPVLICR
jgi:nucleotide-binding universal stress UspA family protein